MSYENPTTENLHNVIQNEQYLNYVTLNMNFSSYPPTHVTNLLNPNCLAIYMTRKDLFRLYELSSSYHILDHELSLANLIKGPRKAP